MGIVILILKIIGIILLILLGILLLAVISIVFYPISYTMAASYEDTISAKAKVHWLFHLISVTLIYETDNKKCILRILGIPIMDFLHPKPKKEKIKQENPKQKKSKKEKNKIEKTKKEKTKKEKAQTGTPEKVEAPQRKAEAKSSKPPVQKQINTPPPDEKDTPSTKQGNIWTKLQQFIINIRQKVKAVQQKGIDLRQKADKCLEILKREQTQNAIEKIKHHIIALLKHILPRKWNAYLNFGFEDPATTGQVLGYYWMLIGLWGEHFVCVPDFEHKVLRGNIRAKGHIQVMKFLYVGYRFMFDKDLVYLRKIYSEINA
jgi:hypothetical protein